MTDVSKAFDCVDHNILLEKIKLYEINKKSHSLFQILPIGQKEKCCNEEFIGKDSAMTEKI